MPRQNPSIDTCIYQHRLNAAGEILHAVNDAGPIALSVSRKIDRQYTIVRKLSDATSPKIGAARPPVNENERPGSLADGNVVQRYLAEFHVLVGRRSHDSLRLNLVGGR